MKKLLFFFIVLAGAGLLILPSCNQGKKSAKEEGTKVPELVMKAFQSKFPAAKKVEWAMEDSTEYEAEFTVDSTKMSANFDAEGNWKETEWKVEVSTLPTAVSDSLNVLYEGFNINKAEVSESPGHGKVYEVLLKNDSTSTEVVLDENGTVVKKEEAKGEEHEKGEK